MDLGVLYWKEDNRELITYTNMIIHYAMQSFLKVYAYTLI